MNNLTARANHLFNGKTMSVVEEGTYFFDTWNHYIVRCYGKIWNGIEPKYMQEVKPETLQYKLNDKWYTVAELEQLEAKVKELDNMLKEQIKYNDKITKTNVSLSEELSGYKDNVVAEYERHRCTRCDNMNNFDVMHTRCDHCLHTGIIKVKVTISKLNE